MTPPSTANRDGSLTVALLVLGAAVSVHMARMVFGTDWLPPTLSQLAFLILAVLMTLVATGLWIFRAHGRVRVLTRVAAVLFTLSLPVHLSTFLTQRTELLRAFPDWFGLLVTMVQFACILGLWWFDPERRAVGPGRQGRTPLVAGIEGAQDRAATGIGRERRYADR
jgi:hypothetical protein